MGNDKILTQEEKRQEIITITRRLQEGTQIIFARSPVYVKVNEIFRFNIFGIWVSLMDNINILTSNGWFDLEESENGVPKAIDALYTRMVLLEKKRLETFN